MKARTVLLVLVVAAGCGGARAASPDTPEDGLLTDVRDERPELARVDDGTVEDAMDEVCDARGQFGDSDAALAEFYDFMIAGVASGGEVPESETASWPAAMDIARGGDVDGDAFAAFVRQVLDAGHCD